MPWPKKAPIWEDSVPSECAGWFQAGTTGAVSLGVQWKSQTSTSAGLKEIKGCTGKLALPVAHVSISHTLMPRDPVSAMACICQVP